MNEIEKAKPVIIGMDQGVTTDLSVSIVTGVLTGIGNIATNCGNLASASWATYDSLTSYADTSSPNWAGISYEHRGLVQAYASKHGVSIPHRHEDIISLLVKAAEERGKEIAESTSIIEMIDLKLSRIDQDKLVSEKDIREFKTLTALKSMLKYSMTSRIGLKDYSDSHTMLHLTILPCENPHLGLNASKDVYSMGEIFAFDSEANPGQAVVRWLDANDKPTTEPGALTYDVSFKGFTDYALGEIKPEEKYVPRKDRIETKPVTVHEPSESLVSALTGAAEIPSAFGERRIWGKTE